MKFKVAAAIPSLLVLITSCKSTPNEPIGNGIFINGLEPATTFTEAVENAKRTPGAETFQVGGSSEVITTPLSIENTVQPISFEQADHYQSFVIRETFEKSCNAEDGFFLVEAGFGASNWDIKTLFQKGLLSAEAYDSSDEYVALIETEPKITSRAQYRSKISNPPKVNDVKTGKEIFLDDVDQDIRAAYSCLKDGKVIGSVVFGKIRLYKMYVYAIYKAGFLYISGEESNRYIQKSLDFVEREQNLKRHKEQGRMIAEERRKSKTKAKIQELENINSLNKKTWELRLSQKIYVGDKICTYENHLGFVDEISGNNYRILLKEKLDGEDGMYFGNWPLEQFSDSNRFRKDFIKLDETVWLPREQISLCTIL